ncbi:Aryl-phospho-beta-D-glucosidase BglC, GH1 family [Mariniphaga anaerophila]|uniref:Aryl-phospho-beta-D-glucosidase BglC, GH1 family n=1 Tax=Mariniphaga anaerophila TaxID=1484053 RepID=A0A1M4SLG6_9BACT|nr:cellulase family glycosylhydrolase [Mariniphaga anaerophila]SHE33019.1 Aryl-phospho-beta-D-glucosidase BglC, GH1 family [Mariniphaga anaerophila]
MYSKPLFALVFLFFLVGMNHVMNAQITPDEAIGQMKKGINLGNTHEPPTEAGWNNPMAQEYYFDLYKNAGFQCVRIPVRWDNYTAKTPPYKIDDYWLNRIEQVATWGLARDLFIVINAHHEQWIKENYSEENKARFDSIWSQIATRFKNKPDKLIFEIINEPHGLTKAQNDDLHARVLAVIRKTNPTRLVIFQGHSWGGSDELIAAAIPDDDYLIGSFHSYDPYLFGLEGEGTWGSAADYNELDKKFEAVADWSDANNVPVFLGEFGAIKSGDHNSRMRHYRAYVELSQKYGFTPVAWDDGGDFRIMEREQRDWNEIKDILISTSAKSPKPFATVYRDSIIQVSWSTNTSDHDSVIVQQKRGTDRHFSVIATLPPNARSFNVVKPPINKYYDFRIIADYTDTAGLYSQPVRVFFPEWTKPERTPFNNTLSIIPGIIEAEDFDKGGEGFTYHDTNEINLAGAYRPDEGVDIYDRQGNGFHVGNALPGEWLEYSVNVLAEGWYNVTAHISTYYGGGQFQIEVDTVSSGPVRVKASNSPLNTLPNSTKMYLYPGNQIMRFTVLESPLFNIDKFEFELLTNTSNLQNNRDYGFVVFQNSARELVIKQTSSVKSEQLEIFNQCGSLTHKIPNPESMENIPRPQLSPGLHIVRGFSERGYCVHKIVIR